MNPAFWDKYRTFISIVAAGTGLNLRVVATWVQAESGPKNNPLNIGPHFSYANDRAAAAATVALLRNPKFAWAGYPAILASAVKSEGEQLKAIASSAWDAGHYDGGRLLASVYSSNFPAGQGTGITDWLGQGGPNVDDWTKGIGKIADAVPGVKLLDQFLSNILSGNFWVRVLLVIFGAIALLGAMVIFTRELAFKKILPGGAS